MCSRVTHQLVDNRESFSCCSEDEEEFWFMTGSSNSATVPSMRSGLGLVMGHVMGQERGPKKTSCTPQPHHTKTTLGGRRSWR